MREVIATDKNNNQELSVDINLETTPIYYTDTIYITANEDGLVFDVLQRVGNTAKAKVVSRVGMSRIHAKKFAAELSKLLAITDSQAKIGEKKN